MRDSTSANSIDEFASSSVALVAETSPTSAAPSQDNLFEPDTVQRLHSCEIADNNASRESDVCRTGLAVESTRWPAAFPAQKRPKLVNSADVRNRTIDRRSRRHRCFWFHFRV